MKNILRGKKTATEFLILVEIARRMPNVRQREVAIALGITPQAVSEYIKELTGKGLLASSQGRYSVTKEGIDFIGRSTQELRKYARFIEEEILGKATIWPAIAGVNLKRGERVNLAMKDGILCAEPFFSAQEASALAMSDARKGEDVAISDFKGLIELRIGSIKVLRIPDVKSGGSKKADLKTLKRLLTRRQLVGCIGLEACAALRKISIKPGFTFGAGEAAVEAALKGLSSSVVVSDSEIPSLLEQLKDFNIQYELIDLRQR